MSRGLTRSAIGLLIALGIAAAVFGAERLSDAPAAEAAPTTVRFDDGLIARQTISRYFTLIDTSRGSEFCREAITAVTVAVEGGIDRCVANIDHYVPRIQRQTFEAAVTDMQQLFYMVSDGIGTHCRTGRPCPQELYGRWADESATPQVSWRTGTNPRLASSSDGKIVAVVDPRRSSPSRITLYYQASDGRILRASWSTAFGAWRGSVVDTHAGNAFISGVRVIGAWRADDGSILATVGMRVGTVPTFERFRLVQENGSWRADSWKNVTSALTA